MSMRRLDSPGLTNRIERMVWQMTWFLLARFTPVGMHKWRAHLLKLFGAKISGNVFPYPNTRVWSPKNLKMEAGSCLGPGVDCYNVASIHLGENVVVSQRAYLCSASHDFDSDEFCLVGASITIEEGAWIAAEAFVGPGSRIGKRAVVLARSVVVRDVAPGSVVGGNPARHIRDRMNPGHDISKGRF